MARKRALADLLARQEIEAAEFRLRSAQARLEIARAQVARAHAQVDRLAVDLARTTVRAPFSGTVGLRHVDPGAVVTAGTPVVHLLGEGTPFVRFAAPPAAAAQLSAGTPVWIEPEGGGGARGVVCRLSPGIDGASRMVFVEAEVDPAETLPVGAVVRVSVATDEPRGGCWTIAAALVEVRP